MKRSIIAFSVIYILLNAFCIANEFYFLNLLPLAMLLGYLLFFQFEVYLFILIALLPVSVPLRTLTQGLPFDLSLPAELLIILLTGFFYLKLFFDNKFDKRIIFHPVSIAICLNIFWLLITSITSSMPLVSFKFLASRIWFVTVFYIILLLVFASYKRFYTYIWSYAIPFVIVMIYFINRLVHEGAGHLVNTANFVSKPFFPDHTSYAAAIAMLIPILLFIIIIKKKANFLSKSFFIGMCIIFFLALILSYTRAAWLSLILSIGFMLITLFRIKLHTTLIIGSILGIILFFSWTDIQMSLARNRQDSSGNLLKHVESVSNISTDASNLERLNRWNCAIRMFKEKPMLGFGPGTYMFQYAPFQKPGEKTIISTNKGTLGNAHSEYLGPLAESGVFGTFTFLAIVLTSLFTASRIFFTASRRKVRYLALALMTGLLSYCIHGIMNDFLDLDKLSALFWGFIAMIVALDIYHTNEKEKKRSIFFY